MPCFWPVLPPLRWSRGLTFLPSFLFILVGGPLVESTHNDLKFTAPLTAITAAVVGVILNLALFFGYHVPGRKASPAYSTGPRRYRAAGRHRAVPLQAERHSWIAARAIGLILNALK